MSNASTPIKVTLGDDSRESFAIGAYPATFLEYEGPIEGEPTPYTDGKPSKYYKFIFEDDEGRTHIGFCDHPKIGSPKIGKRPNKWGRWLAGLAGKPLTQEFALTPSDFYGRKYLLVYAPNSKGNVQLSTFSPID